MTDDDDGRWSLALTSRTVLTHKTIDAQNETSRRQFCNVSIFIQFTAGIPTALNLHFLNKGQTSIFYLSKFH